MKQFPKKTVAGGSQSDSVKAEIEIGKHLYNLKNKKQTLGINSIAHLLQIVEENKDTWLIYELGSQPMSKHLFDVKGEFYKGERLY